MPLDPCASGARNDDGMATVWGLAWVAVCLSVGWLTVLATVVAAAQHSVDGAADLAALSAAGRLQRGGDACVTARRIAADNAVALTGCEIRQSDVVVTVQGTVSLPLGLDGKLTAKARAGP
jgi:secretion/DNA translocation related TadE-like protein